MRLLGKGRRRRSEPAATVAVDRDDELLARLQAGDEQAFATLVDKYHRSLVRLVRAYVPSDAVAEEVVQEAWVGVLRGLDRFEGRSSLRTWIFRIAVNQAKTHGARERRMAASESLSEPSVDPDRFQDGGWSRPPVPWSHAEDRVLAAETQNVVRSAIDGLPDMQRTVISLRDVMGMSAPEVCELLELSEGNQRVLLHRARSRVRSSIEQYMEETS
jgi:RNA polymerase sigma-70 factor (ECF subfamily)